MEDRVVDLESVKAGVLTSLPLLREIRDEVLRGKIVDAWAYSLATNGYESLEELPGNGLPDWPASIGTQSSHLLGVTKMACAAVDIIEEVTRTPLNIDRDLLLACGLCHDLGKPFEYRAENRERWSADPRISGSPALRHTMYGVHVALLYQLPEVVVHTCGCHSMEGQFVKRSLPTTLVHCGDRAYWMILENAHNWILPRRSNSM